MNNLINDKVNFFSYLRPKKNSSKPFIITSPHSGVLLNKDLLNKRNKNIYWKKEQKIFTPRGLG